MIALRYVCGFLLQTLPYAFFCCYPFWERFKINKNHAVLIAAVFLAVAAVPFTIVGAGGFGGERNEFYTNVILSSGDPGGSGTENIRLFYHDELRLFSDGACQHHHQQL